MLYVELELGPDQNNYSAANILPYPNIIFHPNPNGA